MDDLTLQVAQIDDIRIYNAYAPNAGSRQIEAHRSPQATGTHHEHACVNDLLLSLNAHILQQDMP